MKKIIQATFLLCVMSCGLLWADLASLMSERGEISLKELAKYKRALAVDVASKMSEANFRKFLASRLSVEEPSADLVPLMKDYQEIFATRDETTYQAIAAFDQSLQRAKGIDKYLDTLLEIRLVQAEESASSFTENSSALVAYVPGGDEKDWKSIEAFDSSGSAHQLSVEKAPEQSVLVVGLNSQKDLRAGLKLFNEKLQAAGLQQQVSPKSRALDVAKLNYIRVKDDKEPWILGKAEMYILVNGIAPEENKANVISLELPYLDKEDKDYYPNQVVVVWDNYRYHAANINIFEHDDNTSYQELAAKLIQGIGQVSGEYQAIFDLAGEIIRLMPSGWFSNDDDYVDVYYTLEKGKSYNRQKGASNNADIILVPHTISE